MTEDLKFDVVRIQERIGGLQQSVDKAHSRIDNVNKEIKEELKELSKDVKKLLENMHISKGSKATWILVGSLSLALLGALAKILIK